MACFHNKQHGIWFLLGAQPALLWSCHEKTNLNLALPLLDRKTFCSLIILNGHEISDSMGRQDNSGHQKFKAQLEQMEGNPWHTHPFCFSLKQLVPSYPPSNGITSGHKASLKKGHVKQFQREKPWKAKKKKRNKGGGESEHFCWENQKIQGNKKILQNIFFALFALFNF